MIDFYTLQNTVIQALTGSITDVPTEMYPDNPDSYELIHPDGVILVFFQGARYAESSNTGDIVQKGRVNFGVSLCLRDLSNNEKALKLLKKIQDTLLGLEIENFTFWGRAQLESISMPLHSEEGIWIYGLNFYFPHEIAQKMDD